MENENLYERICPQCNQVYYDVYPPNVKATNVCDFCQFVNSIADVKRQEYPNAKVLHLIFRKF